ncbi:MAG: glutamate-1-semialdehyde 2,1-aminomutase [Tissierellia bacterium]|nr:glutamate-1-semialdehyde 2,1-aminomutase [Tissierellia bacterium]
MTLFEEAKKYIPGGVNSPVRAFGSVNRQPIFAKYGKGAYVYAENGEKYIDFINSWGPLILGHSNEILIEKAKKYLEEGITFGLPTSIEVDMARFLTQAIGTDMVRMVNSGTEATMSAIRLARGYTARDKIIKFEGCYHGHSDALLVKSGSGTLTYNVQTSKGVPLDVTKDTLICRYNDIESVKETIEANKDQIACVIIEPVAGNMGVVSPSQTFIKELRRITQEEKILLIFDEVITGFRCKFGSVKDIFGVEPDLYCFGKIIGGGLPVGAFAGRKEIMVHLSPLGGVYQAGTLSGNPLAMKMGLDVLTILKDNPSIYEKLEKHAILLEEGFNKNIKEVGIAAKTVRFKTMLCLFFGNFDKIESYDQVKMANTEAYREYHTFMLKSKILLPPAQFEAMFLSDAQDESIINYTIEQNRKALKYVKEKLNL